MVSIMKSCSFKPYSHPKMFLHICLALVQQSLKGKFMILIHIATHFEREWVEWSYNG